MILIRETTPPTIRLGTVVASVSTPSTRIRTRISRPDWPCPAGCGSKWMSEAPSSAACAMIECTSLMTGASSAESRRSTISTGEPSSSSSTASWTASSKRFIREISAAMSSAEATAGLTSMCVINAMSSTARTFAGSDIATITVCSST